MVSRAQSAGLKDVLHGRPIGHALHPIAVDLPIDSRGGADHTVKAYLVEDGDAFAKVSDARDALGHLQAFGLGPIGELAVRTVDDENWLEAWKASMA